MATILEGSPTMADIKVRTKEELIEMQKKIREEWTKDDLRNRTVSQWIAVAYTQNTINYVLGKFKEPPALTLIRRNRK